MNIFNLPSVPGSGKQTDVAARFESAPLCAVSALADSEVRQHAFLQAFSVLHSFCWLCDVLFFFPCVAFNSRRKKSKIKAHLILTELLICLIVCVLLLVSDR